MLKKFAGFFILFSSLAMADIKTNAPYYSFLRQGLNMADYQQ